MNDTQHFQLTIKFPGQKTQRVASTRKGLADYLKKLHGQGHRGLPSLSEAVPLVSQKRPPIDLSKSRSELK